MKSSPSLVLRCALLLGGLFASSLRAQTPAPGSVEDRLSKLEAEITDVRRQNQDLRQQLGQVSSQTTAATTSQKWPEIRMNVLAGVEYAFTNAPDEPHGTTLGDIDLVTTARLNEQASVVTDFVVASNHGGFAYEIERLVASYKVSDALNIDFGRFHTAMGWYNNFYHNGTYFQTTRDRPEMYLFEDNFGLLPVHSTGISFNGEIAAAGSLGLSYSFEIANGRAYTANEDEALQIEDDNNYKSFNFQLRAKPEALQHWQFGIGAYHDTLTPVLDDENEPGITTRIDQWIFTGHAIFKSPAIEWFTEGSLIGNEAVGGDRHWTFTGYTQLSHKFGKLRPYVRLQWRDAAPMDPVFTLIGENFSSWDSQVGLRYDFTTMMALKFEYDHSQPEDVSSVDEFSTQLSFRF